MTCDYCGRDGHTYLIHPEAVADVRAWTREHAAQLSPFGDHPHDSELA